MPFPALRGLGAAAAFVLLGGGAAADTPICAIQGAAGTPNMLGARVTTGGVVTRDFIAAGMGFFLQDPGCDLDPGTSDGIWVDVGPLRPSVSEGRKVTVTGRVSNAFGLTAIELESLADSGSLGGALEVAALNPPADATAAAAYLEAREGMLVSAPPSRVVAATNHFGEAYVMPESSGVTRLFRGDAGGRKLGLGTPGAWLSLNAGDRLGDLVGPLIYTFGEFKVLLRADRFPAVQRLGAEPPRAATPGGDALTIATYNLEDFFDPVDDPGKDDVESTPSAAQYAVEVARRAVSIGRLLGSPDVLGVQEAEKIEVLEDLAAQPELAGARYRAVLIEGPDPRGIDVGLLYNSSKVQVRSAEARQACSDIRPTDGLAPPCPLAGGPGYLLHGRPPLVARLAVNATGEPLTVIVNHFKSQDGDDTIDERLRLAMADHVRGLVAELKAAEPATPVIVMGDLNDFEDSPPLARLTGDGALVNLEVPLRPYTYVFQGVSQVLDYVLVDPVLLPRVASFGPFHVNVDFAAAAPGAALEATPRASDHDPVLLVLRRP